MKRILSLVFICMNFYTLVFAQQIPIDFSDNNDVFTGFNGSDFAFRSSSPSSASNRGGQFNNNGTNPSQGFYIDLTQPIVLNNDNKQFTLQFYAFDPLSHSILMKLENTGDAVPDVQIKTTITNPSASNWVTVSFDFTNALDSDTGLPVSANGTYTRLSVFIDDGSNQAGTYIIDDITNGATPNPPQDPNAIDVVYDVLVWSDDFDSGMAVESLDATKWFHQTYAPNPTPNGNTWFNGELQHYTDRTDNSYIQNDNLHIVLKREDYQPASQPGAAPLQFTSARLNSKFSFTYGRVDVKAKLPGRQASWPAIWTLGTNISEVGGYWYQAGVTNTSWPACGEIDIMEHGLHAFNTTSSAIHVPGRFGGNPFVDTIGQTDVVNGYHIYSVNWSPNKIVFLVDNTPYFSVTKTQMESNGGTWVFDLDQYLLLNVAVGGFAGNPDVNDFNDSEMVIDYVKVYQNSQLNTQSFEQNKYNVYPNPTSEIINIIGNGTIKGLRMYNMLGRMVYQEKGNVSSFNVQNFTSGIYVLHIETNEATITKKILIN